MAPRAARRFRAGQARGSGTKNIRFEAASRPAENTVRRQAVVAYLAMKSVLVHAYAKVNLCLDILERGASCVSSKAFAPRAPRESRWAEDAAAARVMPLPRSSGSSAWQGSE